MDEKNELNCEEEDLRDAEEVTAKKKTKRRGLKITMYSMVSIVVIVLILFGSALIYVNTRLNKINYVEIGKVEMNEGVREGLEGYRNIVILGIDEFVDEYEETGRSDSIMLVTLNEKTNEVKLTSIYRDTYVEVSGYGLDKINHAYAFGGAELALSTININLDLNATEIVVVNFDSVISAIDVLGGVEIDITSEEVRYINGYINNLSKGTGISTNRITKSGKQMLDGVQAVAYSRIRYTAGGDYKRAERHRIVLDQMLEQAKRAKAADLIKAADEILPLITTNLKKDEIIPTILEVNKYKILEGTGWPYNIRGYETSGPWYGVPVTLENDVIRLHKEVFGRESYEPTAKVKEISAKIIEKTGYSE